MTPFRNRVSVFTRAAVSFRTAVEDLAACPKSSEPARQRMKNIDHALYEMRRERELMQGEQLPPTFAEVDRNRWVYDVRETIRKIEEKCNEVLTMALEFQNVLEQKAKESGESGTHPGQAHWSTERRQIYQEMTTVIPNLCGEISEREAELLGLCRQIDENVVSTPAGGTSTDKMTTEPASSYPPASLSRQADENALKNIEREINRWLFNYVRTSRDVDPVPGRMYEPMSDEEVHAFVAANYHKLWAKVPDHLKQSYREVQSRVHDNLIESARGVTSSQGFANWAGGDRVTLAIVFTDVVGSTALGEELRDDRMNEVRRAHFEQSRKLIGQFKGREIKTIGDSFMAAFRSVEQALDYAMALQANSGHAQVQIRAGIHIGPMRVEENDAFGGTVNFAARVVGKIELAEIWLSERAKEDLDKAGARHQTSPALRPSIIP